MVKLFYKTCIAMFNLYKNKVTTMNFKYIMECVNNLMQKLSNVTY